MASIGDVFLRVMAEMSGFETEVTKGAQKAGDKAAETMNQSLAKGLAKTAGKALLGGFAVAAGIATKGVLELEQATASFRAETGATAEEAEKAGRAINAMAGRNMQPLEEVGRTLTKVHTDLGLTGDAAEAATESFLKYGRATGRDAAEGVTALDDILDAWNLDASKSQEIMDKLIVSHQKYGGSISENEQALSSLAPQLQALNLTVDDGIGLLNIFAASGLDASKAQFALNSAIQKLPPGTTLEAFVAHLASIEDPAQRAKEAITVFGARGGAGLANALRPGRASLDDFAVTMEESTGATKEAADTLDSTFGSRFKLLLKGAGAALTDFGSNFGPAVTGLASLSSLGGAKLGGKLLDVGKRLGTRLGQAVAKGLASSGVVTALSEGLSGALGKVAGSSAVQAVLAKTGTLMGTTLGTAMGAAAALAIPLAIGAGIALVGDEILEGERKKFADMVSAAISAGSLEGMEKAASSLRERLAQAQRAHITGPFVDFLKAQLALVEGALATPAAKVGDTVAGGVVTGVKEGITKGAPGVTAHIGKLFVGPAGPTSLAEAGGAATAGRFMAAFYQGVIEKQGVVQQALAEATSLSQTTMDKAAETAYLTGVLSSTELAHGVNDRRDNVQLAYQEVRRLAEERLSLLVLDGDDVGKKSMDALIKATRSKDPLVRAAAQRTLDVIEAKLNQVNTRPAGNKAVDGVVSQLNSGKGRVGVAAFNLGSAIVRKLLQGITRGGITFTGVPTGNLPGGQHGGSFSEPFIAGEAGRELIIPTPSAQVIPHQQTEQMLANSGGGDTYNVNLPLASASAVESPADVMRQLRRFGEMKLLPRRRGIA